MGTRTFAYDLFGQVTKAAPTTDLVTADVTTTYDALGRVLTSADGRDPNYITSYAYDLAGRRTQMTWFDDYAVTYAWNLYDETSAITEVPPSTWNLPNVALATYGYDADASLLELTGFGDDCVARKTCSRLSEGFRARQGRAQRAASRSIFLWKIDP